MADKAALTFLDAAVLPLFGPISSALPDFLLSYRYSCFLNLFQKKLFLALQKLYLVFELVL